MSEDILLFYSQVDDILVTLDELGIGTGALLGEHTEYTDNDYCRYQCINPCTASQTQHTNAYRSALVCPHQSTVNLADVGGLVGGLET